MPLLRRDHNKSGSLNGTGLDKPGEQADDEPAFIYRKRQQEHHNHRRNHFARHSNNDDSFDIKVCK